MALSCSKKNYLHYYMEQLNGNFYSLNCLHPFRTKTNLNLMKKYVRIKISVEF